MGEGAEPRRVGRLELTWSRRADALYRDGSHDVTVVRPAHIGPRPHLHDMGWLARAMVCVCLVQLLALPFVGTLVVAASPMPVHPALVVFLFTLMWLLAAAMISDLSRGPIPQTRVRAGATGLDVSVGEGEPQRLDATGVARVLASPAYGSDEVFVDVAMQDGTTERVFVGLTGEEADQVVAHLERALRLT